MLITCMFTENENIKDMSIVKTKCIEKFEQTFIANVLLITTNRVKTCPPWLNSCMPK